MKLAQIICSAIALLIATADAAEVQKEGEILKLDTKEARTVVEANKMDISDADVRTNLRKALRDYYVVSKRDFATNYSHVGGMDASGSIEWPVANPPVKWKWLLRPGGLAVITKPDGVVIYLAREKQRSEQDGGGNGG